MLLKTIFEELKNSKNALYVEILILFTKLNTVVTLLQMLELMLNILRSNVIIFNIINFMFIHENIRNYDSIIKIFANIKEDTQKAHWMVKCALNQLRMLKKDDGLKKIFDDFMEVANIELDNNNNNEDNNLNFFIETSLLILRIKKKNNILMSYMKMNL